MSNDRRQRERQEYEFESAREWAKRQEPGGGRTSLNVPDGVAMFSVKKAGNYYLDVMPYKVGKGNPDAAEGKVYWVRTYWTHRGVGAGNDTYCCPRRCGGNKSRCPICEDVDRRFRDLSPDLDGDALKKARQSIGQSSAKMRQLINVIDLNAAEKGIQIWDVSWHLFGKSLKTALDNMDPDEDFDLFYHPKKGKTLKITATEESGGGFSFYDCSTISFKPRKEPYDMAVIEDAHCLDALLKIPTYEQLLRVFLQIPDDEPLPAEDAHGRRTLVPAGGTNGSRARPKDEDDLDDLPPVRKTKPAPAPQEDDDDAPPPRKAAARQEEEDDAPPPRKGGKPQTAEEAGLKVGMKVAYNDSVWKIARVSRDGTSLTLEYLEDEDDKEYAVAPHQVKAVGAGDADEDEGDEDDAPPPPKKKARK